MTFTVYVFLLSVSFAFGSQLCTPDQWEGYEGSLGGYAERDHHGLIKESMKIHYDYTNQRSAVFLDYMNGDFERKYKMLVRYKDGEGRFYVVDLNKTSCWMMKLKKPFRKACIPEGAKKQYTYFLGSYGGLELTSYEYECKERGLKYLFSVETKGDVIIPATENVMGRLGRVDFLQGVGFVNIVGGIKDESVFDIPEECEPRENVTLSEELIRDHYILAL